MVCLYLWKGIPVDYGMPVVSVRDTRQLVSQKGTFVATVVREDT